MKIRNRHIDDMLDACLRQFSHPPAQEMHDAEPRLLRRLHARWPAVSHIPDDVLRSAQQRSPSRHQRAWTHLPSAVAAVLVLGVAIGGAIVWPRGVRVYAAGIDGLQVTLADDSRVEMRAYSEMTVDRASDGIQIDLKTGDIIVTAAGQRDGHVYVRTNDMTVTVDGTAFLASAGQQGSRVGVIEGEVRVREGDVETRLRPGEEVATSPTIARRPLADDIAWSRNATVHLAKIDSFMKGVAQSAAPLTPLARQANVTGAQTPGTAALEFDEASIRPCDPDNLPAAVPGGRGGGGGGSIYMTPGRFYALCMTPATLIRTAYGYYGVGGELAFGTARALNFWRGSVATIPGEDGRRVRGGPDWVRTEKYTIEAVAKVGGGQDVCIPDVLGGRAVPVPSSLANQPDRSCNTANVNAMSGPMLLALLERRFGLKARIVTEQVPSFSLVVAPGGLKMKEGACTPEQTTPGVVSEAEWARRLMEPVRRSLDAARRGDATPGSCGRFGGRGMVDNGPNRILVSEGARVPALVQTLEGILGERVSDRTGIPGTSGFTYALEFVLDDRTRRNPFLAIATDLVQMAADPSSVPPAPNLFTALEQQLGLRLETAQVPREHIVIDAIRRLEPN